MSECVWMNILMDVFHATILQDNNCIFSDLLVVTPLRGTDTDLRQQAEWSASGTIVAGRKMHGGGLNELNSPTGICVDENKTVYIVDSGNHRVNAWSASSNSSETMAGGNKQGIGLHQLNEPSDVVIDRSTNELLICDRGNQRVVRWSRNRHDGGKILLASIDCYGLTMDDHGYLYVAINKEHTVRRFRIGEYTGLVAAGGNGPGDRLDQLHEPSYLFVDSNHSVYVSDEKNHRVVKWLEGAKQGEIVAGGNKEGSDLNQLSRPMGVLVDGMGTIYVSDSANHRIVRWLRGAILGDVIVGNIGYEKNTKELDNPMGLSFDHRGHLYAAMLKNCTVQKFELLAN